MKTLVPTIGLLLILASNAWAGGHWRFERTYVDGADTKTADWSGNGNHGTLVNAPTLTAGRVGRGMSFAGTEHMTLPKSVSVRGQKQFTLAMWVNAANYTSVSGLWAEYIATSSDTVRLSLRFQDLTGLKLAVRGRQQDGDSFTTFVTYPVSSLPATNVWWHLAVVWDAEAELVELFVNGRSVSTGAITNTAFTDAETSQNIFVGNLASLTDPFDGLIDELIKSDFAWTAEEVRAYYHSGEIPSRRAE